MRGVGLGHWFPATAALFSRLSFELASGKVYGLIGPSGSGKSTLLSILAGWIEPKEGKVEKEGIAAIAWVAQHPFGVGKRSVLDHVSLPLMCRGADRASAEREASELLEQFGLAEAKDRNFSALSGGEGQRLMLARAVAKAPQLLLVDEPTAGLDRRTAASVNERMGQLSHRNMIVVVATHDEATMSACDELIDLNKECG
jgi:putative ABC transport system ATP-binding protein